jgi:hypothetical protein
MNDAENTAQDCEQVTVTDRITVALIPRTAASLAALRERTRLTKTELANRAITLYDFIDQQIAAGAAVLIRHPDGSTAEVRFL